MSISIDPRVMTAQERQRSQNVVSEVLAERRRQIEEENYRPDHDDHDHLNGDLARAAACYAVAEHSPLYTWIDTNDYRPLWPWPSKDWRPKDHRRRNLIIAAALLVAEIERLDRAESNS